MNKNKLRIIFAGIYDADKSSLLNALTKGNHSEAVDIPTTATIDTFETDDYIYVDTPGLNANNYDNNTAEQAFKNADVIVFVSNMQNGGLDSAEAEYLKKLSRTLRGMDLLQQHIIFAMSNLHQTEVDNVDKIITEHKNMIRLASGFTPENIFAFDSVTYQEGVSRNEETLIEASGIPALLKHIEKTAVNIAENIQEIRYNKIINKSCALRDKLEEIVDSLEKEYEKIKKIADSECIDKKKVNAVIQKFKNKSFDTPDFYLKSFSCDFRSNNFKEKNYRRFLNIQTGKTVIYKSRSSLTADLKAHMLQYYNKGMNHARMLAQENAADLYNCSVFEKQENNKYFNAISSADNFIVSLNQELIEFNINLPVSLIEKLQIIFNYPAISQQDIADEIISCFENMCSCYSIDDFVENAAENITEHTEVSGFSSTTIYELDSFSERCAADNLTSRWSMDMDKVNEKMEKKFRSYFDSFLSMLESAYQKRINEIMTEAENIINIKNNNDEKKQADELKAKITILRQQIDALNRILNKVQNEY